MLGNSVKGVSGGGQEMYRVEESVKSGIAPATATAVAKLKRHGAPVREGWGGGVCPSDGDYAPRRLRAVPGTTP